MSYEIFIPLAHPEKKHVSLLLQVFRGAWPQGCFVCEDLEDGPVRVVDLRNPARCALQPPCGFTVFKQSKGIYVWDESNQRLRYRTDSRCVDVDVTERGILLTVPEYGSMRHSEVSRVAARFQKVLQRHTRSVGSRVHVF